MGDLSQELHINYLANQDYSGTRNMQDTQELIEFRSKSMHRIWLNDLNVSYSAHWHSAIEIILPLENYYDVIIKDTTYRVQPDEIMFIPPREVHSLEAPNSGARFVYLMNITSISKLRSFSGIQPLLAQPIHMTQESHPLIYNDIYNILVQIRSEYFNQTEFAELTIQALLLNMFVKIGENRTKESDLFASVKPSKQHDYVQRFNAALEYIDENYTEDISLEFLADRIGFSKFHFSRLFKQYTNYNFSDYLCNRRIRAAEELLSNPDSSITEVALESGFASISTFNRIFKQRKGMTPSEYKRHHAIRGNYYTAK